MKVLYKAPVFAHTIKGGKSIKKFKRLSAIILSAMMAVSLLPNYAFAETSEEIKGEVDGQTYTNNFIGITCTLPDDYTYYDEDTIKELNGFTQDAIKDDDIKELLENSNSYTDMYAASLEGGNVNVALASNVIELDEKDFLEASIDTCKKTLESMGAEDLKVELKEDSEFCGEEMPSLEFEMTLNNTSVYETLYAVNCDGYIATITFASSDKDSNADIAECFEYCE